MYDSSLLSVFIGICFRYKENFLMAMCTNPTIYPIIYVYIIYHFAKPHVSIQIVHINHYGILWIVIDADEWSLYNMRKSF